MKYTQENLIKVLKSFNLPWMETVIKEHSVGYPKLVEMVILYLWSENVPENENTQFIRRLYNDLTKKGWFDFEKEE